MKYNMKYNTKYGESKLGAYTVQYKHTCYISKQFYVILYMTFGITLTAVFIFSCTQMNIRRKQLSKNICSMYIVLGLSKLLWLVKREGLLPLWVTGDRG